jgi:hypothetical protein
VAKELKEYSFFEQISISVVAHSEEEARAIARAGGGDRSGEVEYEAYCESTVEKGRKSAMESLDVDLIPRLKSICVNDQIIDDEADRDPRLAELRRLAKEAGWVKIWFTPSFNHGDGPCIVHWPSFSGDANMTDSVYDNWEHLAWEYCLADIEEPNLDTMEPHLKWK